MPSNSSDQISQTSCWLQIPLPTGGAELKRKKGASLLHQEVGNSTSGPSGVSMQYGRSVSSALLWYTKPCFFRSSMVCLLGSADGDREPSGVTPSTFLKMSRLFTSSASSSSRPLRDEGRSWR